MVSFLRWDGTRLWLVSQWFLIDFGPCADDSNPVLRNPLYFAMLFILCVGAYVTYQLNLWGPMISMANAASTQALEEGKKRLREFLEASDTRRQAIAMSSGDDSYEMSKLNRRKVKDKLDGADDDGDDEI